MTEVAKAGTFSSKTMFGLQTSAQRSASLCKLPSAAAVRAGLGPEAGVNGPHGGDIAKTSNFGRAFKNATSTRKSGIIVQVGNKILWTSDFREHSSAATTILHPNACATVDHASSEPDASDAIDLPLNMTFSSSAENSPPKN